MPSFLSLCAVSCCILLSSVPSTTAASYTCDVAVVGAGPGGSYVANRLATHFGTSKKVCVFEQKQRVGGRVHSLRNMGPAKDLVVEAGAYRFATDLACEPEGPHEQWCIHTPLTKAMILDYLKLPSRIYDPRASSWDHALSIIVDSEGNQAGYVTFVEELLGRVNQSVPVYLGKELRTITPAASGYELAFADGSTASADDIVLNLPQMPLLRILARSKQLVSVEAAVPEALHAVVAFPLMKMYVHYKDAWWVNMLNLTAGTFNNSAAWSGDGSDPHKDATCTDSTQLPVPVKGSYHDADVRCDGAAGLCRGYIQAVYLGELEAIRLYQQYHVTDNDGDSVLELQSASSPEDARILRRVHEGLVEVHADALRAKGDEVLEKVKRNLPDSAILSIWDQQALGIETGCHAPRELRKSRSSVYSDDNGVPEARIPIESMRPLAHSPRLFVANEAFGTMHCFAEGSLTMAENVVHTGFGVPRPDWIDADVYAHDVIFNTTTHSAAEKVALARGWKAHPLGDLHFTS